MDFEWVVKYATEFLGTAILIVLGNGAVANVELKGTPERLVSHRCRLRYGGHDSSFDVW